MKRRTSNRFAARAARWASSSAFSASAMYLSSGIGGLLGEEEAEDGGQAERTGRERGGPPVPDPFGGMLLLVGDRHAVDEAVELLDRLGRRDERDHDGDERVGQEGCDRAPEGRRLRGAEVEPAPVVPVVRDRRAGGAR